MTYRFLALIALGSIDRVVVLCNMQMQVMLIGKVLLAFTAAVHVNLLIVHIVFFNRCKSERLVRGQ